MYAAITARRVQRRGVGYTDWIVLPLRVGCSQAAARQERDW
jgi:hypothetical protein